MEGVMKCSANYVPLTPISFLERAAQVYGDRTSIVYGSIKFSWEQTRERCHKLASSLVSIGISSGDVVAVISGNTPWVYELHYAVPMAGAVICNITPHYGPDILCDLLCRSNAKLVFVDDRFLDLAKDALRLLSPLRTPTLISISGASSDVPTSSAVEMDYETFLGSGDAEFKVRWPADEFSPISVCFTSGTTDAPKGVIHNHRAAFLNTIATIMLMEMAPGTIFLWTSPMYHCNGWGFVWGVAAQGGTNVILRDEATAEAVFDAIEEHGVTMLSGATPVLAMLAADRRVLSRRVSVLTGGAPPPPDVLMRMEEQGFRVTHSGGQTETYCCAVYCMRRPEWEELPRETRARLQARQGLPHLLLAQVDIKDPMTMKSVPSDGVTVGEVVYRGNNVMSGYVDRGATEEAFRGGWFHSGDLAVRHPDGYIEFKDRLLDRVERGGHTVGTLEIESVIYGHPAVIAAGVVGVSGDSEGEVLCAFVELKQGHEATTEDILEFFRQRLPDSKVPEMVVIGKIPITSTGKIQKAILREKGKEILASSSFKKEEQEMATACDPVKEETI